LKDVLRRLLAGELTEDEALGELRSLQLEELGGRARLDLGRFMRRGIPEVVLATGKAPAEAARLAIALAERQGQGLISRMTPEHRAAIGHAAGAAHMSVVDHANSARVLRPGFEPERRDGKVALLTAGTSDVAVAEEALMVIEACGLGTRLEADLGVAGLHRFIGPLEQVLEWGADVLVVAAGMDGVLPGLVAGLIDVPVIGLPVSTGYGRGGAGEAALGTMLQSCSTGLVVVNIDNGVGAGAAAVLIAARAASARSVSAGAAARSPRSQPRSRPAARPRG
jgi:NCAIR mutase (PurE)-related protein